MRTLLAAFFIVILDLGHSRSNRTAQPHNWKLIHLRFKSLVYLMKQLKSPLRLALPPLLLRLQRLSSSSAGPSAVSLQSLAVRQEITERVLATSA